MKKEISIDIGVGCVVDAIVITVDKKALQAWCCGLCLFVGRMIDELVINDMTGRQSLVMSWGAGRKNRSFKASGRDVCDVRSAKLKKHLRCRGEGLEEILTFYLEYFRDGFTAVDHCDVDAGPPEERSMSSTYVTFMAADYAPPQTEDPSWILDL